MEKRLFEAACAGNIDVLHQLLQENPLILAAFAVNSPYESPLHIATKARQLDFVREIIRQKSELVKELNQDGFRPIDMASALGYVEIVRELLVTGPEICRLAGRDGRTALHYAAINGKVEVIDELLTACAESIKDVTSLGETALHLAVKYYKFDAFRCLVHWLKQLGSEEMVNRIDKDGNTVLHVAASRKQLESVQLLLGSIDTISGSLELNAINSRGLTAMDVLDIVLESPSDVKLREILQCAGALGARDLNSMSLAPSLQIVTANNQTELTLHRGSSMDWFKYFRFQLQRDSPSDARNALLLVAALIATVTFQAGVNPPSGFLQEKALENSSPASPPDASPPAHRHPVAIYGLAALSANLASLATSTWFLFGNTLGLAASLSIIIYLTAGYPFQRELQISIYSMMFAYGFSINNIRPNGVAKYVCFGIAFILPFLLRWPPRWAKKVRKWWRKSRTYQAL